MIKFKTKIIINSVNAECQKEAREKVEAMLIFLKDNGFELHLDKEFHSHSWLDYGDISDELVSQHIYDIKKVEEYNKEQNG